MDRVGSPDATRMAELLAALSLGIDLGFNQPMEHVLRQCRIALRLGELVGVSVDARVAVYYTALLVNVGCHTDAHEQAHWFGDDIAMKSTKYDHEPFSVGDIAAMLRLLGSGATPMHRVRVAFDFAISGRKEVDGMIEGHARLARALAEQLGLPDDVIAGVGASYERWDSKGWPGHLAGDAIPLASRITQLADFMEVAHRAGGMDAARAVPSVDRYRLGHSQGVADLAADAGRDLGMGPDEIGELYRAALVTSFGNLGVSNAIWDKPGPLTAGEWERVRLAPHLTERMLRQSESLAVLGRVASQHRERLDGSGYPRGLDGSAITRGGRVLAAADAYQAMREPRPYRDARTAEDAARELRAEVRAGRLDASATDAVLRAAGHSVRRRRDGPAGLTAREVEVLRLLARGLSNKEIAALLVITPKTAGNHVEHIYTKIGTSNRATASLYAMQHGLLPETST